MAFAIKLKYQTIKKPLLASVKKNIDENRKENKGKKTIDLVEKEKTRIFCTN